MRQTTRGFLTRPSRTGVLAALAAALLGTAAYAQFPPPPGLPGGPRFQGGPGGPGGPGGRMPFALGKVTAVDPDAGTVTIASEFGGDSQVVHVAGGAAIQAQTAGTAADLKVGDSLQARSSGSGLTITLGQVGPGGPGGPGFRPGGPGGQSSTGSLMVSGKIVSTDPLVVAVGKDATVTLKPSSTTKITRTVTLPVSGIKVGDTVAARGQAGDGGSFSATSLAINPDLGGFGGPGGPGFGPRPSFAGGPGGPGFGGPGPGGPGDPGADGPGPGGPPPADPGAAPPEGAPQ